LNHPKEQIRIAAVRALGTLGDRASIAVLEPLARDDRSDRLAAAAKEALESLNKDAPLVPQELVELRKLTSQLQTESRQLRKDVDELKKQLEAGDENGEEHEP
jgi:aminopeptidase N